jgi:DNA repair protein RecO (recombination protein O)
MDLADVSKIALPVADTAATRFSGEPAYVLHAWAWRESSLIVEFLTRSYGREVTIAKGARRPRSLVRGLLEPFCLLAVSASGKGEVKTLGKVDWIPQEPAPHGLALLSGFYANELLLAVLARHDPHPEVFDAYQQLLAGLRASGSDGALRRFELALLKASGMAPDFTRDSVGQPVLGKQTYTLVEGQGWVAGAQRSVDLVSARGEVLCHIAQQQFDEPITRSAIRLLLRALLQRAAHGATKAVGHRSRQAWLEYSALLEKSGEENARRPTSERVELSAT